jgi:hypothetical protein
MIPAARITMSREIVEDDKFAITENLQKLWQRKRIHGRPLAGRVTASRKVEDSTDSMSLQIPSHQQIGQAPSMRKASRSDDNR